MPKRSIHPRRKETKLRVKNISKRWKKRTKVPRESVAWKLLKQIVFIICLTLFSYQSTTFLLVYYKYPTTTKIEFTYPKEFEFPAVTFCNRNPLKRSKFCAEFPDLCERPSNITEVCEIEPSACKDNPSNLLIPKLGFLGNSSRESRQEVLNAMREIYYTGNTSIEFWKEWAWRIKGYGIHTTKQYTLISYSKMKPVFVPLGGMYSPCWAENLLLNCTDEPDKIDLDPRFRSQRIHSYKIFLQRSEQILFGREPYVFFSIHSPFVPVNPFDQGSILKLGHKYKIYIKLEEENLLPFPYASDCIIYEDSWNENNPQRLRSQEMCQELCLHSLFEPYKNMTPEFEMLEYPLEICLGLECQTSPEDTKILQQCKKACKPSCRNLKYTSTVFETLQDVSKQKIRDSEYERDKIDVEIFLGDRQVIVERRVAVYDTGHLFSYIGGLMGCWLGVSIWAFPRIAQNAFRRTLQWMKQIKKYFNETSQTSKAVFATHRTNVRKIRIL